VGEKGYSDRRCLPSQSIGLNPKFALLVTAGLLLTFTMVGLVGCNANTVSPKTPTEPSEFSDSEYASTRAASPTTSGDKLNPPKGTEAAEINCTAFENWTIDFQQTGGFAGRSLSLRLSSSGQLTVTDEDLGVQVTMEISSEELAQIEQSLVEACPIKTEGPFMIYPDCFLYTLTVSINGGQIQVKASDATLNNTELRTLIGRLSSLLNRELSDQ